MKYVLIVLFFALGVFIGRVVSDKVLEKFLQLIFFPFVIIYKPFRLLFKGVHKSVFENTLKMLPRLKAFHLGRFYLIIDWEAEKVTNRIFFLRVKKDG